MLYIRYVKLPFKFFDQVLVVVEDVAGVDVVEEVVVGEDVVVVDHFCETGIIN